jgi:hypothetical protein
MPITGLKANNFSSDSGDLTAIRNLLGLGTANDTAFRSLTLSGQSLTGSQATSLASLSAIWNTTGTPTAIDLNVTDTASNANSLLMNLRVGGTSQFSVNRGRSGVVATEVVITSPSGNPAIRSGTAQPLSVGTASSSVSFCGNLWTVSAATGILSSANRNYAISLGGDVNIQGDAANILALRNSTNANTLRVFETYTSGSGTNASNNIVGKWLSIETATGICSIFTRAGTSGGGPASTLQIGAGANAAISMSTSADVSFPGGSISMNRAAGNGDTRCIFRGSTGESYWGFSSLMDIVWKTADSGSWFSGLVIDLVMGRDSSNTLGLWTDKARGTRADLSLRSIVGTGNLTFASLPTSDPGVPGRIWRSGSDLKVSV